MIIDLEEAKKEIERGHKFREIDKEIENIKKELRDLGVEIYWRNDNLFSYKKEFEKIELERKNMSFFKKIFISRETKDKYLKEVGEIKSNIEVAEKKIFDINKKIEELELQLEILKSKRDSYSQQKLLTENCFDEYNNYLVVTDKDVVNGKREVIHGDVIKENPSNYCLVHCTASLPKERKILTNKDGKKVLSKVVTIDGVSKEVEFYSPRQTLHFTINHRVKNTSDGMGNWDNKKYIIIEPLANHINQIDNWSINDCWTIGSLNLSDKAVIMIPKNDLDSIPKETLNEYNVVLYDGNQDICLNNTLVMLGYVLPRKDNVYGDDRSHFLSNFSFFESNLEERNRLAAYLSHYKGEQRQCFNRDEFIFFKEHLDLITPNILSSDELVKLSDELGEFPNFVNLVVKYGFKKQNDKVIFDDNEAFRVAQTGYVDDQLKNNIKDLSDFYFHGKENISIEDISANFDNFPNINKENVDIKEILNLNIKDLYDYDYHKKAKCLTSYLKELVPLKDMSLIISFAGDKMNLYMDVPKNIMIDNLSKEFSNVIVNKGRTLNFYSKAADIYLDGYYLTISIDVSNNVSVRDFIYQYKEIATRVYEEVQRCIDTAKIALDKSSIENDLIQKHDNIIKH